MEVKFKKFDEKRTFKKPKYATNGSSGMDLYASITEDVVLIPGDFKMIGTNLILEMCHGQEAQIRSKSGLALKNGIFVLNSPGTVDSDYRGEICVILKNSGHSNFVVKNGMKIAQMIFCDISKVDLVETDDISNTIRGSGGFGSTGI